MLAKPILLAYHLRANRTLTIEIGGRMTTVEQKHRVPAFTDALVTDWADILTRKRLQAGKQYKDIEQETGIPYNTLTKAFTLGGSKETMEKICTCLGIAIEELYR